MPFFKLPGQDSNLDCLAPESALAAKMISRWRIVGRKVSQIYNACQALVRSLEIMNEGLGHRTHVKKPKRV